MNSVDANEIKKAFLLFINVESLNEKTKLENAFDEFESLVVSSGLIIHGSKCLKQTAPVINTFFIILDSLIYQNLLTYLLK